MIHIPRSGFNLPSPAVGDFLRSLEPICGRNAVGAALRLSGLETWIGSYPGIDSGTSVDFADISSFLHALEQLYGPRSGRALAQRAGWATFDSIQASFGVAGMLFRAASRPMSHTAKLRLGLAIFSHLMNQHSDQLTSVKELPDSFSFSFQRCAICWGRKADSPACTVHLGLIERALRWGTRDHDFEIAETRCIAQGQDACEFQIRKEPLS